MKLSICKLKPKSSLHLGEREGFREGTEKFIHSDTLFSAFCHNYLLLYGKEELEKLLKNFYNNNPSFIISSAFPYWNDRLYFPIPENQLPKEKRLKKKDFIEKSGFEELLFGTSVEKIVESKFIPNENNKNPYTIIDTPRIALSRFTNQPGENYFHFGEIFYNDNAGLFFLYILYDIKFEKRFISTIRLMCDEGIGGDRSSGKGFFEQPIFDEIKIKVPDSSNAITLSLYLPLPGELTDLDKSYYKIITRKGYIYSLQTQSLRKRSVRMFAEGSVFSSKKVGRLADVTPTIFKEHKIYRYGLAFTLPCILEVKNES